MPGTWQSLQHQPAFWPGPAFLLTDGSVFCHEWQTRRWWRLWPNAVGAYASSSWHPAGQMHHPRLYYCAAVLADGRLFLGGGYWTKNGKAFAVDSAEIYDPQSDLWAMVSAPKQLFGTTPMCCVLADGRVLVGGSETTQCALYDPILDQWSGAGGQTKAETSSEETWTLLASNSVFTVEAQFPVSAIESYVAAKDSWAKGATPPVALTGAAAYGEPGSAIALTDGRVFAIGSIGHTALYTPANNPTDPGTWAAGPDLPKDTLGELMPAWSAPTCLLPNGKVFFAAGPSAYGGTHGGGPSHFYEYNMQTEFPELDEVENPFTNPQDSAPPYAIRMVLLPNGQVLVLDSSLAQQNAARIYTPDGTPFDGWRPTITLHPSTIKAGSIYPLRGQQINGLSQALCHGKSPSGATNYPLVRLHDPVSNHVWYCPTANHSSMGVATGKTVESTSFLVPNGVALGSLELVVIANGIASVSVKVTVKAAEPSFMVDGGLVNTLIGSRADGPMWGLGPNGVVPIGPFNGPLRQEAQRGYQLLIDGLRALERVGGEILNKRLQEAASEPGPLLPGGSQPNPIAPPLNRGRGPTA